jgi:hypothetical protein
MRRPLYCEVLGFRQIPTPAHLAARGGCWFRWDHVELHLGDEDPFVPARKAHPAMLVEPFGNRLELIGARVSPG